MNLKLIRKERRADGIFSELFDDQNQRIACTLEHSYDNEPKIPNGEFVCRRGEHKLHGMDHTFTTFEITGVEGHDNLLFHWGNFNKDSEGCVLLGEAFAQKGSEEMITNSKTTFSKFMSLLNGFGEFILSVEG